MNKYILIILSLFFGLLTMFLIGASEVRAAECTPGTYSRTCTGRCGGCADNAGEIEVKQCQSNGTWGSSWGECSTSCEGPCKTTVTATPAPGGTNDPRLDGPGGCCVKGGPSDNGENCRTIGGFNEVCDIPNGYCGTGNNAYSCRSISGCALDTDCGPGHVCKGGSCIAGTPYPHCQSAGSLQARFQLNDTSSWATQLTIPLGQTVNAGLFRNGSSSFAGSPVNGIPIVDTITAKITGPNGFSSSINPAAANSFKPTVAGEYSLSGTCVEITSDNAKLTVTGASACSIGFQDPDVGAACADCLATQNNTIVPQIKKDNPAAAVCSVNEIINYWCNGGVAGGAQQDCTNLKNSPACSSVCAGAPANTYNVFYKFSEDKMTLQNPASITDWLDYKPTSEADPSYPTTYTFLDTNAGLKTLYVIYKYVFADSTPTVYSGIFQDSITLLPGMAVSSCLGSYTLAGDGTEVRIEGTNFGPDGSATVLINGKTATISSWNTDADGKSTIIASINEKLVNPITVTLQPTTGSAIPIRCDIGVTATDITLKTQCRPDGKFDLEEVNIKVIDMTNPTNQPITKQATVDETGRVTGLEDIAFNEGHRYALLVSSPHNLTRRVEFNAGTGTTVVGDVLYPGDIAPVNIGDGTINTLDKSELNNEWNLVEEITRLGDLNLDSRVNSVDWACMRKNFNKASEQ